MGDHGPFHRTRGTHFRQEAREARDTPWYTKFFGENYLRAYASHFTPERAAREVEGMAALLALPRGSFVLDLCCGHGRHAIALAERGHRVTGLNLSPVLLHLAASDARARGSVCTGCGATCVRFPSRTSSMR
jgi:ubiquinone/menaquinone biosynthesis C-methylase UbiE